MPSINNEINAPAGVGIRNDSRLRQVKSVLCLCIGAGAQQRPVQVPQDCLTDLAVWQSYAYCLAGLCLASVEVGHLLRQLLAGCKDEGVLQTHSVSQMDDG